MELEYKFKHTVDELQKVVSQAKKNSQISEKKRCEVTLECIDRLIYSSAWIGNYFKIIRLDFHLYFSDIILEGRYNGYMPKESREKIISALKNNGFKVKKTWWGQNYKISWN